MRKILLGAVAAGLMATAAYAAGALQQYTPVNSAPYVWNRLGYSQFSITGAAVANLAGVAVSGSPTQTAGTIAAIPANAACALIQVSTAAIRWRDDGTAPTSTVGMPWLNTTTINTPLRYCSDDLTKFQVIAVSGTPVLDVYFTQ